MTLPLADGRKVFLDFRKKAPLTATADMYLDKGGNVVKRSSNNAHLAVDVPSSGFGLKPARLQYVTMPRTALLKPAIELAQKGFVLDRPDVGMLATATADFSKDWIGVPSSLQRRAVRRRPEAQAEGTRPDVACREPAQRRRFPRGRAEFARRRRAVPRGGKPVGDNRFYGANDPRRNSGSALGY